MILNIQCNIAPLIEIKLLAISIVLSILFKSLCLFYDMFQFTQCLFDTHILNVAVFACVQPLDVNWTLLKAGLRLSRLLMRWGQVLNQVAAVHISGSMAFRLRT